MINDYVLNSVQKLSLNFYQEIYKPNAVSTDIMLFIL